MELGIRVFAVIPIGNFEFRITETMVVSWGIIAILTILAILARIKLRNFSDKPKGLQNFIELCVELFEKFTKNSAGEKLSYLGPWYFTVFIFLLFANISGMFPFVRPPTADWPLPLALALATFVLLQFVSLKYRPKLYLKSFIEPWFIFFPMNLLGELARPIALSFRLFGNILGGMILLNLLYAMAPVAARFVLPVALHAYFDIAAGALHAFIFTVLSLAFLGVAASAD